MGNVLSDNVLDSLRLDKYRTLQHASLKCARLALGDGQQQRLVSFKDLRKAQVAKDHDTEPCSIHGAADSRTETVRSKGCQRGSFDGDGLPHQTYWSAKKC
jgi:hypothetical protein